MKRTLLLTILLSGCSWAGCKAPQRSSVMVTGSTRMQSAEAGCATCVFGMKTVTGCELAVKIEGKPYLVVGSDIDDHGDAHADDGLCNSARNAVFEGTIEGDQFMATKFQLEP